MSAHLAERIYKPPFFKIKPLIQGRGERSPYVIGFDSEAHSCGLSKHKRCAENGYPFLYQFAHPGDQCDLIDVPRTGEKYETAYTFIQYLRDTCTRKDVEYLVFGFNLGYEYTQLWRDVSSAVYSAPQFTLGTRDDPSELPDGTPFIINVFNQKRYTFTVEFLRTKRRVKVVDAMAFLPGSLDGAAKMIGAGKKLKKPAVFDRGASRTPELIAYATQDAILTQRVGEWVTGMHEQYDVTQCISAPHFASKVFKRAFLKIEIPLAHPQLEQAGLESYHGGKNGYYLNSPALLPDVWHVDIRSAYPEAMRQLPDPSRAEWLYHDGYTKGLHGLYCITGTYRRCSFRGLMDRDSWLSTGDVAGVWVTSYELDGAIERGEMTLTECHGYMMVGPSGGPLVEYVDRFYGVKRNAKTDTERTAAKLFLNSLYGKFFQKVAQGSVGAVVLGTNEFITTDPSEAYDYQAGGLYHPPIASLITGYVRAKIHHLEHEYGSIMTSTDGFFSYKAPDPTLLGKELGMLSAERGTLRILRERVYVFDPDEPTHDDECTERCAKPHPIFALHGFMGSVLDLRRVPLIAGNVYHYVATRMATLRMSTRRIGGVLYAPGEFFEEHRSMILPGTASGP